MAAIGLMISMAIIACSLIIGMWIVASGQLLFVVREIALNTRKEGALGSNYKTLEVMASLITATGVIIAAGGTGFALISIIATFSA